MTRHLDPDRSPPVELFPFPIDIETGVCNRCSALVPMTDTAKRIHRADHAKVDALEAMAATVALTSQLSGSGSNAGLTKPDSPGPGSNVPTPPQEDTESRGGVEGANGSQADAGTPPSGVTETPDPASPRRGRSGVANLVSREEMLKAWEPLAESVPEELGGINRSRPGGPGDAPTGRLPLPELGNPARFA